MKRKLNAEERKYCMEIFGYDFILDSQFGVWLIEVNTNPCIEESSPLLEKLLPRMIGKCILIKFEDDAFQLSLDNLFPKKMKGKQHRPITSNLRSEGQETIAVPLSQLL